MLFKSGIFLSWKSKVGVRALTGFCMTRIEIHSLEFSEFGQSWLMQNTKVLTET